MTTDWEPLIAALLEELSAVQGELLTLLSEKRQLLAAGNGDGLLAMAAEEQRLLARLEACHARRNELLNDAAKQGLRADSIGSLVGQLPEGAVRLPAALDDARRRTRLLQHQALTNWVVIQRTLLHLAQMIEIIATGGQMQPTYDKGVSCGALVDQVA